MIWVKLIHRLTQTPKINLPNRVYIIVLYQYILPDVLVHYGVDIVTM